MKLTPIDHAKLWGEDGPYSEVHLIIETRILDDAVSRIFLVVEVNINPFTYEIIKKHRKLFQNDPLIQEFLDYAEFRGQAFGYVSCAFSDEYQNEEVMKNANEKVEYCKATIIKMHKYILGIIKENIQN